MTALAMSSLGNSNAHWNTAMSPGTFGSELVWMGFRLWLLNVEKYFDSHSVALLVLIFSAFLT